MKEKRKENESLSVNIINIFMGNASKIGLIFIFIFVEGAVGAVAVGGRCESNICVAPLVSRGWSVSGSSCETEAMCVKGGNDPGCCGGSCDAVQCEPPYSEKVAMPGRNLTCEGESLGESPGGEVGEVREAAGCIPKNDPGCCQRECEPSLCTADFLYLGLGSALGNGVCRTSSQKACVTGGNDPGCCARACRVGDFVPNADPTQRCRLDQPCFVSCRGGFVVRGGGLAKEGEQGGVQMGYCRFADGGGKTGDGERELVFETENKCVEVGEKESGQQQELVEDAPEFLLEDENLERIEPKIEKNGVRGVGYLTFPLFFLLS